MDNYLNSCPTEEERDRKSNKLVKSVTLGGFHLTKFVTNLPNKPILDQSDSVDAKPLPTGDASSHVLGLKWNHTTDTLVVSRGIGPNKRNFSKFFNDDVTQRVVLSLVSAVYDPIGLVAPFTIKARLLLKDIWRLSGQQWDGRHREQILGVEK